MKTESRKANYAFIDAQNLNAWLHRLGWKIDWKKFRTYLAEERNIEVAYIFLGFMPDYQDLYLVLQKAGFVVVFKEILTNKDGDVKGNIDAELILQAMVDYDRYDRALIVSGDGDFTCLLRYLAQNDKLEWVLAPFEKSLSSLIGRAAEGKIEHLRSLRRKVEYRYGTPVQKTVKPERVPFVPEEMNAQIPVKKSENTPRALIQDKRSKPVTKDTKKPISPRPSAPTTTTPIVQESNSSEQKAPHRSSRRRRGSRKPSAPKKREDGQYDGFWEM